MLNNFMYSEMEMLVRDVAFIATCVLEEKYKFWEDNDTLQIPWENRWFTDELCQYSLPLLKSIAVEVPSNIDEYPIVDAPGYLVSLSKMLAVGTIDVVRLLYRKACVDESRSTDRAFIFKSFGRPKEGTLSAQPLVVSSPYSKDGQSFRIAEVTPWTVGSHGAWFSEIEKMERLVEITRWEDSEAGTSTLT